MVRVTDDDVRAREAEVDDLIGRYETILVMLRKERDGLRNALQVMEGLHRRPHYSIPPELPGAEEEESAGAAASDAASDTEPGPKKPQGIPPMPTIIIEALVKASDDDRSGLEPGELTAFVRDNYWPEAGTGNVLPTAWRMVKDGRLTRVGELYALPASTSNALKRVEEATEALVETLSAATSHFS